MKFDDGFFTPWAEGNLPLANNYHIMHPEKAVQRIRRRRNIPQLTEGQNMQYVYRRRSTAPTLDSFAAFGDLPDYGPPAPGQSSAQYVSPAITGNSIVDAISGFVTGITPAIAGRIAPTPRSTTPTQSQLMQQYLKGQLPGYEIDPATGQLRPKSNLMPILIIGGVALLALGAFGLSRR